VSHNEDRRPTSGGTAIESSGRRDFTSIPPSTDTDKVSGVYVALVNTDDEHCRRRVFLTLAAAERCVRRAEARGQRTELYLCRLEVA